MQQSLTKKQQETLDYIESYITQHGQAPLLSEIQEHFDLSAIRSVSQRLEALEEKGYITRDSFKHRSIRIVGSNLFIEMPVYGLAGCDSQSVFAEEDMIGQITIPKKLVGSRDVIALKAEGDSMVKAGVNSGDHLLIEKTQSVSDGDRVVAVVDDMAVLKTLRTYEGGYILQPEAEGYSPIVLTDNSHIVGKLVQVVPTGTS